MNNLKTTALFLSLLIASAGFTACADNAEQSGGASDTSSSNTVSSETDGIYTKPDVKFNNDNVNILLWSYSTLPVIEENGDIVDDAVYKRNAKVEEELGVKLSYDIRDGGVADYGTWLSTLQASIMAGDNEYQLAGGYGYRLASDVLNGSFQNLNANPYIDFSKPYWPANIVEAMSIGGNVFSCVGNIEPEYYNCTYAVYYNKRLAEEEGVGSLYKLVYSGDWTLDKLFELAENGARDLNGDTSIDENDQLGYISDKNMCIDAFIQACDVQITKTNADGIPELLGLTEKYVDVQKKVSDFIYNSGVVSFGSSDDKKLFASGQGLFMPNSLGASTTLRDMKDDFGILPYPKYTKEQESYISFNAVGNSAAYVVPITADEKLVGCVLEALAYYGYRDVLPEYYEITLKGKVSRDDDSTKMLDLIFDNIRFDFTQIYSYRFGDQKAPSMGMRMATKNQADLSSLWAADEKLYAATMESLIASLN